MESFDSLQRALATKDYKIVASLLSHNRNPPIAPRNLCTFEPSAYNEIVSATLKASVVPAKEAFAKCVDAIQAFIKGRLSETLLNGEISILKVLVRNLYNGSRKADSSKSEEAARILSRCLNMALSDRSIGDNSKKWAVLVIVGHLFRLYFRLDTLRLGGNIVRAIDALGEDFPSIEAFPKAEAVTYLYFRGRYALTEGDFAAAEGHLSRACKLLHPQDVTHLRHLTAYLVILRLIVGGRRIRRSLLDRLDLSSQYSDLTLAVSTGNLCLFDRALQQNQSFLLHLGLYLPIQMHLKMIILRTFIKRIYTIGQSVKVLGEHRLPLGHLMTAFGLLHLYNLSLDEVECWVANLIFSVLHAYYDNSLLHFINRDTSVDTFHMKRV